MVLHPHLLDPKLRGSAWQNRICPVLNLDLSNLHLFLSVNCLGEDRSCDLLAWDGFPGEEP